MSYDCKYNGLKRKNRTLNPSRQQTENVLTIHSLLFSLYIYINVYLFLALVLVVSFQCFISVLRSS